MPLFEIIPEKVGIINVRDKCANSISNQVRENIMNDKTKRIKITADGPYLVTENIPVHQEKIVADEKGFSADWKKGKEYDTKEHVKDGHYALCRCGKSKNMPFCDGTHEHTEFNKKVVADRRPYNDAARVYEGEEIDLLDRVDLCGVARFCDRFGDVWHMTIQSGPEHPDYAEKAIDEACKCPTGRLTARKNGVEIEPELDKEIGVIEDVPADVKGPLWVKGGIIIEDSDNCEYEVRNRVTLCRCGASRNMPYCDATHMKCKHMQGVDEE